MWNISNILGSTITNGARRTREVKSRIALVQAAFNKEKALFTSKLNLDLKKKLIQCYIWSIALYGAESGTLQKVDQKYLKSFEMWCLRRMERIIWPNHVRNEEVLHRVKKERNILYTLERRKANWMDHICRNCLPKHLTEWKIQGRIKVMGRWGRRYKQLLITWRKKKDTGNWKRKHYITLCSELTLEEAMDLS